MLSFQTNKFAYYQRGDIVEVFAKKPSGELINFPDTPEFAVQASVNNRQDLTKLAEELENE